MPPKSTHPLSALNRSPEEIARIAAIANRNATVRAASKVIQFVAIAAVTFGLFVAAIEYSRFRGSCAAPSSDVRP
jgi:hypothetical protein